MHGRVTNRCTFEMNGRPITIVSSISGEPSLLIISFFGFDDEVILRLDINLLTLEYAFYNTDSRSNIFKEGKDDTNQVLVMTSNISFSIV